MYSMSAHLHVAGPCAGSGEIRVLQLLSFADQNTVFLPHHLTRLDWCLWSDRVLGSSVLSVIPLSKLPTYCSGVVSVTEVSGTLGFG